MIQQHMWNWGLFISKTMLSHIGVDNFFGGGFWCSRGLREEKAHAEEEMESEKEEEDSEEEMESSRSKPELAAAAATESDTPALTKVQARELRRVRKLDHSWLAGLLDS